MHVVRTELSTTTLQNDVTERVGGQIARSHPLNGVRSMPLAFVDDNGRKFYTNDDAPAFNPPFSFCLLATESLREGTTDTEGMEGASLNNRSR